MSVSANDRERVCTCKIKKDEIDDVSTSNYEEVMRDRNPDLIC